MAGTGDFIEENKGLLLVAALAAVGAAFLSKKGGKVGGRRFRSFRRRARRFVARGRRRFGGRRFSRRFFRGRRFRRFGRR